MAEIDIVKTTDRQLTEQERTQLMSLLFGGYVNGLSEQDRDEWRIFWSTIKGMSAGEVIKFTFKKVRNGKFHCKFFALLRFAYQAWEPNRQHKQYKGMAVAKNFERFRKEVTILAGFYEQTFDLDGHMKLEALSISFASMDDIEFERLYSAVIDVILDKVLTGYKNRDELDVVLEQVMRFI